MEDDPQHEKYEWRKQVFQQSLAYSDKLEERLFSISVQSNKMLIALSSGTLALSMTTFKQLFNCPSEIMLLKWSWCLFGSTILLMFLGIFLSSQAIKKQIIIGRNYYNEVINCVEDQDIIPPKNPYSIYLALLSSLTAVVFVAAYFLLGLFVMDNI